MRGRRLAAAVGCAIAVTATPAAMAAPAADTWMPPAYLLWRTGGLPTGLTPRVVRLQGTEHVVVVSGDTLWMSRSVRDDGTVVDRRSGRYRIPIEVTATSARDLRPFLPQAWRDEVVGALRDGRGVLGESSAALRRLDVGGRIVFADGRIVVGAVVPDEVASWSEVMVSRDVGQRLGVRHPRFALLDMSGDPTERELARRIAPLLGPGYPPRVRRPGHAEFRRQADSVWPPVLMKRGFGEFRAYADPNRLGYLRMQPAFTQDHLASRQVPLLGRFTCHRKVFPPLIAAMRELRSLGRGAVIRNFAGCYNARMVMRRPSGAISHHSWGAAVDINSLTNPYGSPPNQPAILVRVMREHGFTWGGRWTVPDGMHFEFVGIAGLP
jgi:hypothetical protein